jgi:5-methyltetrahydropteroyltriglutamate--homocysteine methyltransferase
VLLGVVDVGSETVETAETVADRLRAALQHTEPGHLFACADCGMMPFARRAAAGKLRALAAGLMGQSRSGVAGS